MPPPTIYVMSTEATGPRDDRRPAGLIHAAPSTYPPSHTTFCGGSHGLFWFGHVDFRTVTAGRCAECITAVDAIERAVLDRAMAERAAAERSAGTAATTGTTDDGTVGRGHGGPIGTVPVPGADGGAGAGAA
jgi:hypothetical protein